MIDAAPPAYLSCTIGEEIVEIVADEASQIATVSHPRWRISNRVEAVFSPGKVIVDTGATTYDIDQVTLAVTSQFRLPGLRPKVQSGQCSVVAPPADRKF